MSRTITGGCACGAIHYECSAEPIVMLNCHCRDCQRASGSAYAAIVVAPKAAVTIQGEPRYHKTDGQPGKAVERGFCPNCGSPLFVKLERLPDILALQAGSLADPSHFQPKLDSFVSSAQPWDHMDPKLPKHAHGVQN